MSDDSLPNNIAIDNLLGNGSESISNKRSPSLSWYKPSSTDMSSFSNYSSSCWEKSFGFLDIGDKFTLKATIDIQKITMSNVMLQFNMSAKFEVLCNGSVVGSFGDTKYNSGSNVPITPGSNKTVNFSTTSSSYTISTSGVYSVRFVLYGTWKGTSAGTGSVTFDTTNSSVSITGSSTISTNTSTTIYNNGILIKNNNGGIVMNDVACMMKCQNSTIILKNGDIYMGFDGQTPRALSVMKEKFRIATDGLKRKWIEVLTIGEPYTEENE